MLMKGMLILNAFGMQENAGRLTPIKAGVGRPRHD
jgi:hypothetical protein